jgi:hypothetical protein
VLQREEEAIMPGHRWFFALLACATVIAGCGGDDSSPADTAETSDTTEGGTDGDTGTDGEPDAADVPADIPADIPADVPTDIPADIPADIPLDIPLDIPTDVPADIPADVAVDIPTDTVSYPRCEARGGTCTEYRWVVCPVGTEPAAGEGHEDCPGGGWCCVPAPSSTCSSSGYTNCVEGERCTGCWAAPDDTSLTCEAGRVCCLDICD